MKKLTLYIIIILIILVLSLLFINLNPNKIIGNPILPLKKTIKVYVEPVTTYPQPEKFNYDYIWANWENKENVDFIKVNSREEADVILRWIREYSDNKVGYTFEGKFVEVGFGDSNCGGRWYKYDRFTTDRILRHELGHVLGKEHNNDPSDVMYYQIPKFYSYSVSGLIKDGKSIGGVLTGSCKDILEAEKQGVIF